MKKEIKETILEVLSEAKKKKDKKKEKEALPNGRKVQPTDWSYSPELDMSAPLGDENLYKIQGAANFGPYTGVDKHCKDDGVKLSVKIKESLTKESAWNLAEAFKTASAGGKVPVDAGDMTASGKPKIKAVQRTHGVDKLSGANNAQISKDEMGLTRIVNGEEEYSWDGSALYKIDGGNKQRVNWRNDPKLTALVAKVKGSK